ncbi:hypothetical protein R6Q59_011831 [Mikania micrantha]
MGVDEASLTLKWYMVLKGRHTSMCNDPNQVWDEMAEKVTKAAKETLGMTIGDKNEQRGVMVVERRGANQS